MRRLAAAAALTVSAALLSAGPAHAGPTCTFLGQNYDVQYDCLENQPWLPWGTANNPPLGGSGVTPGGDGPVVGGREPGWSGPDCPACSS